MLVKILGSAAGGGFPQWNCACSNCSAIRKGTFRGKSRSQLQVALSSDGAAWFLLNASPDLHAHIGANRFLHPQGGVRHSPISGVVLTSADLDQSLGLLLLRELQPLQIYATASIRRILREDNSMFAMLHRVNDQARWHDIAPSQTFELVAASGERSGIECFALSTESRYPSYVAATRAAQLVPSEAVLGLILKSPSGERLGYFPAIGKISDSLLRDLDSLDALLFDGTFWSDNELVRLQGQGETARQMGHLPVSGEGGSLDLLSKLPVPRKMFVHINNTNPMLDESGPQYRQVREAGWEIAEDGCHLEL